ncbi:unnamed protein product [Cuscuta campestris]|uniref:Uncharacterized protein n=1 Tax=Cuscuta campestris TaxID=132261 RepID=A0A484L0M8_9ASTE|nr:unnamed protein product [Cuscuta campestris]
MAANPRRTILQVMSPAYIEEDLIGLQTSEAHTFDIQPAMFQMASDDQFGGSKAEDPRAHMLWAYWSHPRKNLIILLRSDLFLRWLPKRMRS